MLGLKGSKKWLILPVITSIFLLQYAIWGWTPYASLLRRFGIRTRQEIDLERYAMKTLRGDFDEVSSQESSINRAKEAANQSKSV